MPSGVWRDYNWCLFHTQVQSIVDNQSTGFILEIGSRNCICINRQDLNQATPPDRWNKTRTDTWKRHQRLTVNKHLIQQASTALPRQILWLMPPPSNRNSQRPWPVNTSTHEWQRAFRCSPCQMGNQQPKEHPTKAHDGTKYWKNKDCDNDPNNDTKHFRPLFFITIKRCVFDELGMTIIVKNIKKAAKATLFKTHYSQA